MSGHKPRLPWKRGPAAWKVAGRADEILGTLSGSPRHFYSLRPAALLLGISTQPLREWLKRGYLHQSGPRRQIKREELIRFVHWLQARAEHFDPFHYLERFPHTYPFKKLGRLQFVWPKGRKALAPRELAALAGCHPSLVLKAIRQGRLLARRRSNCRWEVTRNAWLKAGYTYSI